MAIFRRTSEGEYVESEGKVFSKSFSESIQKKLHEFNDGDIVYIEFHYSMKMTIISMYKIDNTLNPTTN